MTDYMFWRSSMALSLVQKIQVDLGARARWVR